MKALEDEEEPRALVDILLFDFAQEVEIVVALLLGREVGQAEVFRFAHCFVHSS